MAEGIKRGMLALGMIETRGLTASIEAADVSIAERAGLADTLLDIIPDSSKILSLSINSLCLHIPFSSSIYIFLYFTSYMKERQRRSFIFTKTLAVKC